MQDESLIPLLLRTAHFIRRKYTEVIREHTDLSYQQFNVLRVLREAEQSGDGLLATMEIARRLTEPGVGITRLVTKLSEKRLITLAPAANDSRVKQCELTNKGRAELAKLAEPLKSLVGDAMLGVDRYAEADMAHALSLMLKNIE